MACGQSGVVAPTPVPTSPPPPATVPDITISAFITIQGDATAGTASMWTALLSPSRVPGLVSFTLSVKTDPSDSVKDASVDWGDGETTDLGAVSQAVTSHSYATAGAVVLTVKVETSAGRQALMPIHVTV